MENNDGPPILIGLSWIFHGFSIDFPVQLLGYPHFLGRERRESQPEEVVAGSIFDRVNKTIQITSPLCSSRKALMNDVTWPHRCPKFPLVGWWKKRVLKLPLSQHINDDRWYTKPAPLVLPKGHYCLTLTVGYCDDSRIWCWGLVIQIYWVWVRESLCLPMARDIGCGFAVLGVYSIFTLSSCSMSQYIIVQHMIFPLFTALWIEPDFTFLSFTIAGRMPGISSPRSSSCRVRRTTERLCSSAWAKRLGARNAQHENCHTKAGFHTSDLRQKEFHLLWLHMGWWDTRSHRHKRRSPGCSREVDPGIEQAVLGESPLHHEFLWNSYVQCRDSGQPLRKSLLSRVQAEPGHGASWIAGLWCLYRQPLRNKGPWCPSSPMVWGLQRRVAVCAAWWMVSQRAAVRSDLLPFQGKGSWMHWSSAWIRSNILWPPAIRRAPPGSHCYLFCIWLTGFDLYPKMDGL